MKSPKDIKIFEDIQRDAEKKFLKKDKKKKAKMKVSGGDVKKLSRIIKGE